VGVGPFIVDARTQAEIPVGSEVVTLKQRSRLRAMRDGAAAGGGSPGLLLASPVPAQQPPPAPVEMLATGLLLRPMVVSIVGAIMWQMGLGGSAAAEAAGSSSEYVSVYELERQEQERVAAEDAEAAAAARRAMYAEW